MAWRRWGGSSIAAALVAFVTLALVVTARLRLREMPLERDEGEYAYVGQLIGQGVAPYTLAYTMKLPGTHALCAAFLALFGGGAAAIRVGLLLTSLASTVFVYLLTHVYEGKAGAFVAAAAFAALSASPSVLGLSAHATQFVVPFALAGLIAVLTALRTGRRSWLFGAGVLLGLATLMKQNAVLFAALALIVVGRGVWPSQLVGAASRMGLLALGTLLPLAVTATLLIHAGVFPHFWFWAVEYGTAYAFQVGPSEARVYFGLSFSRLLRAAPLLWSLALGGAGLAAWRDWRARRPSFALAFTACSAIAVCPGLWFRPHYYVLFLPAAVILAAVGWSAIERGLVRALGAGAGALVAGTMAMVAVGQPLYRNRTLLFASTPVEASRLLYGANPFAEAELVAAFLRTQTSPGERIAVLGSEPQIYFYAQRRAATGYLYVYPLMEPQPFARRMQKEMIAEVESAAPGYVVLVDGNLSWLVRPDSDRSILDWADRFLRSGYDLVDSVATPREAPPGPASAHRILVWRRKPRATA